MRLRQHVNPLKANFLRIAIEPPAIPEGVPLEVELGSAEAHFLMERAAESPEGFYVGVEIRRELAAAANAACARAGLRQVRSVFANMTVDLGRLFRPGTVRRFFLNFPDPWWKARQHKRRVMSPELVDELHGLLGEGGEIHVATDSFTIALDAMAVLEREPPRRFANLLAPWSFLRASPLSARSRRERQCEALGRRIWRLGYRRL